MAAHKIIEGRVTLFEFFHQVENPIMMSQLSVREKTILSLVSAGLTTKEIADALNISHHTVESHRKNLLRKCGAKNVAELVNKTLRMTDSC